MSNLSISCVPRHTCWAHSWVNRCCERFEVPDGPFLSVARPKRTLMFFLSHYELCFTDWEVQSEFHSQMSLFLSGSVSHPSISSASLGPSRILSSLPKPGKFCWMNQSSHAHLPPRWLRCPKPCLQLPLFYRFFLALSYTCRPQTMGISLRSFLHPFSSCLCWFALEKWNRSFNSRGLDHQMIKK